MPTPSATTWSICTSTEVFAPETKSTVRAVVRIDQQPAQHLAVAGAGLEHRIEQVSPQRVVAGVAPVAVDIRPRLPEPGAVVAGVRVAGHDRERRRAVECERRVGDPTR